MEYEIGISCVDNYLRPSLAGMHLKIVERDTMDEVTEYIESILNVDEMLQYGDKYWSYMDWSKLYGKDEPEGGMRYGVMSFKAEDGYEWSIDISEHSNQSDYQNYKEPKFTYVDIDD